MKWRFRFSYPVARGCGVHRARIRREYIIILARPTASSAATCAVIVQRHNFAKANFHGSFFHDLRMNLLGRESCKRDFHKHSHLRRANKSKSSSVNFCSPNVNPDFLLKINLEWLYEKKYRVHKYAFVLVINYDWSIMIKTAWKLLSIWIVFWINVFLIRLFCPFVSFEWFTADDLRKWITDIN